MARPPELRSPDDSIHQARSRECFRELNAYHERLDLFDMYCQLAKEEEVLVSLNSDAYSTLDFNNLRFGIGQARLRLARERRCSGGHLGLL